MRQTLGEVLQELREDSGESKEQVSRETRLSASVIDRLENDKVTGVTKIRKWLEELADHYKVPVEDLYRGVFF